MTVLDWLVDSDPSIRWQTLQDLVNAAAAVVAAERARLATEGWGAQLLALQEDGQWGEARSSLRRSSTRARASPGPLLNPRSRCCEVELCINGRTVALGVYFGQDVESIVARLLGEQLEDGGWNCEAENSSLRSWFDTTINVLEGLLAHERATGGSAESIGARRRAEEYLLDRKLFRRKSTGEVVDPAWLQFSFSTRWHYDALRALDYFRTAGDPPDPRVDEAIELLRSKQQPDGTWQLENTHRGKVHFLLEDGDGLPSRWNTLRALRVLRWYESG